jgi:hypothetical protein
MEKIMTIVFILPQSSIIQMMVTVFALSTVEEPIEADKGVGEYQEEH